MEAIVRSHSNVTRPFVYDMMSTLMGVGLLTSPRDVWRHRRRILNPAFHSRNLHSFVPVISRRCESLVAQLSSNKALYSENYFDVLATITSTTFGVLLETVLGTHVEDTDLQKLGLTEALQGFCSGFMARMVNVLHWWDAIYDLTEEAKHYKRCCAILRNYTRRIMLKRKEELKAKATCKNYTAPFLDILLQMHLEDGSFTEEEVLDETVTIFAAGYDTTASLASYSLYLLGNHADAQARLHEELDDTFGMDTRRPVTVDDLRRMRYLSCVIKETLRLYPSIPVMGRNIEEDMMIGGQLIPKGTIAMCLIYFLHRHPRFHENPYSFTPERFLNGATGQHPYAYQPFFGGPRNCIGQRFALQEAKIVVAQVMRHFQVDSKLSESELQLELGIVLRPSQGLEVRLTPRKNSAES
ncbi:cytochrome P450 4V2-like [Haemaphysalis longicornis]